MLLLSNSWGTSLGDASLSEDEKRGIAPAVESAMKGSDD